MDRITKPRAKAQPHDQASPRDMGPTARNREIDILSAVSAQVHHAPDVPTLLRNALAELLRGLGLRAGWIFLGDEADEGLHLAAAQGLSPLYVEQVAREGLQPCLCHEVFATGRNMVAHNTTQCPRMPNLIEGGDAPSPTRAFPSSSRAAAEGS